MNLRNLCYLHLGQVSPDACTDHRMRNIVALLSTGIAMMGYLRSRGAFIMHVQCSYIAVGSVGRCEGGSAIPVTAPKPTGHGPRRMTLPIARKTSLALLNEGRRVPPPLMRIALLQIHARLSRLRPNESSICNYTSVSTSGFRPESEPILLTLRMPKRASSFANWTFRIGFLN